MGDRNWTEMQMLNNISEDQVDDNVQIMALASVSRTASDLIIKNFYNKIEIMFSKINNQMNYY